MSDLFRPMEGAEIISRSFGLFKDHFTTLVLVALFPMAGFVGADMALSLLKLPLLDHLFYSMIFLLVTNAIAMEALSKAGVQIVMGQTPTLRSAYVNAIGKHFFIIAGANLLYGVIVGFGMVLFVLPGLLAGGMLAPALPLVIIERKGPIAAIKASFKLMETQLLHGILVFMYFTVISGFIPYFFHQLVGIGPFTPLLNILLGAITLPLGFMAYLVMYFSRRSATPEGAQELKTTLGHWVEAPPT